LSGDAILQDAESDVRVHAFISNRLKQDYRQKLGDHVAEIGNLCDAMGAKFISVSTDTPIFDTFYDVLLGGSATNNYK